MNYFSENSNVSTQESSCSLLDDQITCKEEQSPILKNQAKSLSSQVSLSSKKQYVLKTCRYVDKRNQEIPFEKMFLTCLDILIVESATQMDKLKQFRFLSSFNYFKSIINVERKILQDWICVNLQYVTMKKIPIKVMQQRLCNSKQKQGKEVSDLLEQQLLTYNHSYKNNLFKMISTKQMEQTLQNKFCYFLEIDQSQNKEDNMDRFNYNFTVKSIYFSALLSKLVAGDTSSFVSNITSNGIPEIYSDDVSYFDFWTQRLTGQNKKINSSIRTLDNYNFKCVENIRMFKSEEKGTLLIQVTFDFEAAIPSSSNSCSQSEMMNVYKFLKSERKQLAYLIKNQKINLFSDNFVTSLFEEEKQKNFNSKLGTQNSLQTSCSLSYLPSKNNSPCKSNKNNQAVSQMYGFKELNELY